MRLTSFGHAAVLVDTGSERILVDPWLTSRLDRFWIRSPDLPPGLEDEFRSGLDAIFFTHHHFDHHHFPSLAGLPLDQDADFDETRSQRGAVRCFYPRLAGVPAFTASGLGHQAIAWTLRRLGFTNATPVTPGDVLKLGDTTIRTFRSAVPFPEMSLLISAGGASVMLCGDSLLHSSTVEVFLGPERPKVDLALLPAHSTAPPGVLTERRNVSAADEVRNRARTTFERYADVIGASVTVPSSFGWRVNEERGDCYDWVNRTIFPFTPVQAAQSLDELGRTNLLCGPGQILQVADGEVEVADGPYLAKPYDFETVYEEVTMDAGTVVPPYDPAADRYGRQRESADELVERLAEDLVGTDYWYRAAETGRPHFIEIGSDDGDHSFVIDVAGGRVLPLPAGRRSCVAEEIGFTRIAGSTLQALFDSDLLFGSAFGLWASTENLLSAVFHHPRFYVRHVQKELSG